ncbi:glycoside hydrolase family 16 protein [Fulvivirgaceae bacterium BMA10]|uniref:Glycoside hydrolase family 16 protein n=1 Tax=Splendidivirga corallicola TaxID=3051826 RepID=A0ABT8KNE6_9BACT|nr:glycoside hydrolase family 16 protein [Fulvivirgaceae bacterium BMA10]
MLQRNTIILTVFMTFIAFSGSAQYNTEFDELVWQEEFDYQGHPNPAFWTYEEGFVRNKEEQYYTRRNKKNVRVEDGYLIIEAIQDEKPKKVARRGTKHLSPRLHNRYKYTKVKPKITSGSINTLGKVNFQYGRIEVRAKIPTGIGSWPAIWTLGADIGEVGYPQCGEIDIMENIGYEPNNIYGTVHTPGSKIDANKVPRYEVFKLKKPWEDFHTYAIEWYEDRIDFFVDEKKYFTYHKYKEHPEYWRFDKAHYLLLNLAVGGSWGGAKGVDNKIFPLKYYVDYVRYYR